MSRYTIAVKKGNAEYSISSDSREFIVLHINKVFSELKDIPSFVAVDNIVKLDIEKSKDAIHSETLNVSIEPEAIAESEPVQEEQTCEEQVLSSEEEQAFDAIRENETASSSDSILETNAVEEDESQVEVSSVEEERSQAQDEFSFENILEDKLQTQEDNDAVPITSSFDYESIIKMKQPESLVDYLVITAYYMLENEGMETFQLKQLNSKLFKSMKMVVDRKTMQKALEDGLVDVISSGFDNDGIAEYTLTPKGREFYINGCA